MFRSFIDNNDVIGTFLKGAARALEVNFGVGCKLSDVAARSIAMESVRVGSRSNIAPWTNTGHLRFLAASACDGCSTCTLFLPEAV